VLCYGVLKGTMQWIFGFAGDRYGRKPLVVGGLLTCVLGLVMLGGLGVNNTNPKAGFFVAALLIGFGTAMMYSNLLAAICDHADPSWRASALGAYQLLNSLRSTAQQSPP
jgi:MFS family permease